MPILTRRDLLMSGMAAGVGLGASAGLGQQAGLAQRPPVRPVPGSAQLVARSGLSATVGYAVMDAKSGAMIETGNAAVPIPPASTMKALTALYALDRLGGDFRFRTRIIRSGDLLVLAGGGDPVLSTDGLAGLADDLVSTGQVPPKRFAVWGGALPRIVEIAPGQDDHLAYNPTLSGMILNFNRVHLGWQRTDDGYQMSLQARAAANSPRAYSIAAQPGAQRDLFLYHVEGNREVWTISRAAMGRAGSRWLPVRQPELYAGDVFQTLCRARGLVLPAPEVLDGPPTGDEIVGLDSPPMTQLLQDMLLYSTNLTAEAIGLRASAAQDLTASAGAMQGWLTTMGPLQSFHLADHSGLSEQSRVTAEGLVSLLAGAGVAARLEPLLKRDPLRDSLGAAASAGAQVAAKTGTLNFVSNLAGYATTPSGRSLAFAILCADTQRHEASTGQELPAGVSTWTRGAKVLQNDLIEGWAGRFG